jgi:hypothetical protein
MSRIQIIFYQEENGCPPVVEWLEKLHHLDREAYAKCVPCIRRLAELGQDLWRPETGYVCGGICELRVRHGYVNYRILYFFYGQNVAILAHAMTKEGEIPEADIEGAIRRQETFE